MALKSSKRPGWTPEQLNFFVEGKTDKEIAELTGKKPNTVYAQRRTKKVRDLLAAAAPKKKAVKQAGKTKEGSLKSIQAKAKQIEQKEPGAFFVAFGTVSIGVNTNTYAAVSLDGNTITLIPR